MKNNQDHFQQVISSIANENIRLKNSINSLLTQLQLVHQQSIKQQFAILAEDNELTSFISKRLTSQLDNISINYLINNNSIANYQVDSITGLIVFYRSNLFKVNTARTIATLALPEGFPIYSIEYPELNFSTIEFQDSIYYIRWENKLISSLRTQLHEYPHKKMTVETN